MYQDQYFANPKLQQILTLRDKNELCTHTTILRTKKNSALVCTWRHPKPYRIVL